MLIYNQLRRLKTLLVNIKRFYWSISPKGFVPNINFDYVEKQKKVLLSYSSCSFSYDYPSVLYHSNSREITQFIKILIELDFCVDVIDCDYPFPNKVIGRKTYDVVIGFGEPYKLACLNSPNAIKIFYLTENLPSYVAEKSKERYIYYKKRTKNRRIGIRRDATLFKEEYLYLSDFVIELRASPLNLDNITEYCISPTGLINSNYVWMDKDFKKAKRNFLWFGSSGAIHKGLDILVDIFKRLPDLNLYIYGLDKSESFVLKAKSDNIHVCGIINVNSPLYLTEIVERCAFVILPSCSEAQSTSVITNMLHGLIPIVSRECQFPKFPFGFQLDNYTVEYVAEVVNVVAELSVEELRDRSYKTYIYAREHYVIKAYASKLKSILENIILNGVGHNENNRK